MEIRQITEDKDNYLEMLLIADPQENMIRRIWIKVICLCWKMPVKC